MAAVRIRPVDPPYSSEMQADFDKLMRGSPPLLLFRTVACQPQNRQAAKLLSSPVPLPRDQVQGGGDVRATAVNCASRS